MGRSRAPVSHTGKPGHGAPRKRLAMALLAAVVTGIVGSAATLPQRALAGGAAAAQQFIPNVPYDGRFTFVRLRYEMPMSFGGGGGGGGGFGGRGCYSGSLAWLHDYPCAEQNFAALLRELTLLRPYMGGSNILDLDDPELFKFPVAYMSEPGRWFPNDREARALGDYLAKGGFIIFDDFGGGRDWQVFEAAFLKAVPNADFVRLDGSEPIFHNFFEIDDLENISPPYRGNQPEFLAVYEGNDRTKRILAIINFNNDLGDYWEYSGTGWYPVDMTNEAYKLGINYIIYSMTH
jgi:hypothetical protein